MVCYKPYQAFFLNGEVKICKRTPVRLDDIFYLPCSNCIGCRLERSRQWAVRCMYESKYHVDNTFVTLTYSPEFLPSDGSLSVEVHQKFMKRLRHHFGPVRFMMCGEYGEDKWRPHYHYILFGLDFSDKVFYKRRNGFDLYNSPSLDEVWPFGHAVIAGFSFESAAYVSRYIVKKVNGKKAKEHYARVDPESGELRQLLPEFSRMSRKPGLAYQWFEDNFLEVYPSDSVIVPRLKDGVTHYFLQKPPRYFDKLLEKRCSVSYEYVKTLRANSIDARLDDFSFDRLAVKEKKKLLDFKKLIRTLDLES